MRTLLLLPLAFYILWHGMLLPLPWWMPPEHPIIAAEERFYRATDPVGYLRFVEVTRAYDINIQATDKSSEWFQALPDFMQRARMFVWDTPTVWVNGSLWVDPAITLSVVEHELIHVLSRWYPDYVLRTEGVVPPPVDIEDWRTWAPQELFASNIQLRVAKRLNTPVGVQYAKDLGHLFWNAMSQEQQVNFFDTYSEWLELEFQEMFASNSAMRVLSN